MDKYKKVVSPILMVILTLMIIFVIVFITCLHILNLNNIKSQIENLGYFEGTENIIINELKSYMTEDKIENLINSNKIKDDIYLLLDSIKSNTLNEGLEEIRQRFENNLLNIIDNIDVDKSSVDIYTKKISNKYINNLLPSSEIKFIQEIYQSIYRIIVFTLILFSVSIILIVIYLFNSGKQIKWLFIAIYNSIIASVLFIITFNSFGNVYYMNDAVTMLIKAILNGMILDVIIMTLLLVISVSILNYIIYFKRTKKHSIK